MSSESLVWWQQIQYADSGCSLTDEYKNNHSAVNRRDGGDF